MEVVNLSDSLKHATTVVADTGDIEAIAKYRPQGATSNRTCPGPYSDGGRKPGTRRRGPLPRERNRR
jgi:hypothetical protein